MITLYRWLLLLIPTDLRRAHRDDMVALLGDRLRDAQGPAARVRLWVGALGDAVAVGLIARFRTVLRAPETTRSRFRFAARALIRRPAFGLGAILTLGLALGMLTAVWTALDMTMLRPLPYPHDEELALANGPLISAETMRQWNEGAPGIQRAIPWSLGRGVVRGGEGVTRVRTMLVGDGFLQELGARPLMGRTLVPSDYLPNAIPVAVVAESLWDGHFGEGAALAGQTISLDGQPVEVVGVLSNSFQVVVYREIAIWTPLRSDQAPASAIVRMAPGWTTEMVLGPLMEFTLASADPEVVATLDEQRDRYVILQSFRDIMRGGSSESLWSLALAAAVVLLVAAANVSALFLTRTEERSQEFALRTTLGSSRSALVADMATEAFIVAMVGGALALLIAPVVLNALLTGVPGIIPDLNPLVIDARVALATGAASLATVALVGILPALMILRGDGATRVGRSARMPMPARRLLNGLVFAEVSAAMVLMIGAGLLWRTFVGLYPSDPGFTSKGKLVVDIELPGEDYPTPASISSFASELQAGAAGRTGPVRSEVTTLVPFADLWYLIPLNAVDGAAVVEGQPDDIHFRAITPDYHEFMGMELIEGRLITGDDPAGGAPVTVINQAAARANWPGLPSPLGRTLTFTSGHESVEWTVVGVVGDVRTEGTRTAPRPTAFVPFAQAPQRRLSWVVLAGESGFGEGDARAAVRAVDPGVPVTVVRSFEKLISDSMRLPRFQLFLMTALAGAAILLAGLGCFSVLSWSIRRGRRELGIRAALGAPSSQILLHLIGSVARVGAAGCAVGIGLSWLLSSWVEAHFFLQGVTPRDPATYLSATLLVTMVLALATIAPGRRALRVDPAATMKE